MPRIQLNDRALERYKLGPEDVVELTDNKTPAFGVRVARRRDAAPSFTFFVRYTVGRGRRRRQALGVWPETSVGAARRKALEALRLAREGDDPALEGSARRRAVSVAELVDAYRGHLRARLAGRGARLSPVTAKEYLRILDREVVPLWGDLDSARLTSRHVRALLRSIAEGERDSPVMANRVRAVTSALFAFGLQHEDLLSGVLDRNPVAGIPQLVSEEPRDAVLRREEIVALWAVCDRERTHPTPFESGRNWPTAARLHQLALLTGARKSELLGARRREVGDDGWWEIPADRQGNKARRSRRIWLAPLARRVLGDLGEDGTSPLFPSLRGRHPLTTVTRHTRRYERLAGIAGLRLHQLRHTMATELSKLGVLEQVVAEVLGHKPQTVTGRVYTHHRHTAEVRRALERWARHLERLHGVGEHQTVLFGTFGHQ